MINWSEYSAATSHLAGDVASSGSLPIFAEASDRFHGAGVVWGTEDAPTAFDNSVAIADAWLIAGCFPLGHPASIVRVSGDSSAKSVVMRSRCVRTKMRASDTVRVGAFAYGPEVESGVPAPTPQERRHVATYAALFDVKDATNEAKRDAIAFIKAMPENCPTPHVWGNPDEVVFEWMHDGKHAVASFEGDGVIGYTLRQHGTFVPGEIEGASPETMPRDLWDYLAAA